MHNRRKELGIGPLVVLGLALTLLLGCQSEAPSRTGQAEPTAVSMQAPAASLEPTEVAVSANPVTATAGLTMTHVISETALTYPSDLPAHQGICFGSSNVVPSLSAWQCKLHTPLTDGTDTMDPCLQQPDGTLVCNPAGDAFVLMPTDPLPAQPTTAGQSAGTPWYLVIPALSGSAGDAPLTCMRDLMPDITIDGRTVSFTCGGEGADGGHDVLLGDLTTGDLWTATLARIIPQGDGWSVEAERVVALSAVRIYNSPLDSAAQAGFGATTVIDYVPIQPDGPVQRGSCFSGALAVTDPHAWRCNVDNSIADPCFEIAGAPDLLVCTPDPLTGDPGFTLQLTEPLPLSEVALTADGSPWLVELADGARCGVATGATGGVNGERINYLCTSESEELVGLIGTPQAGLSTDDSSTALWSAQRAVVAIGENGPYAIELGWVPLKTIVRGPQQFAPLACAGLASDVEQLLGAPVVATTTSFDDYVTGGSGTACKVHVEGTGTDFPDISATAALLQTYFSDQGWREDIAYQAGGPTGEGTGYRNGSSLCLVDLGWSPPAGMCPDDQPIASCEVAPQDRQVSINIACARDVYSTATTDSAIPGQENPERIAFAPGTTQAQWSGNLAAGQVQQFVFRAMEGQTVTLEVDAPAGAVGISIVGSQDGTPLPAPATDVLSQTCLIPATADYIIRIATRESTAYTAELSIPAP